MGLKSFVLTIAAVGASVLGPAPDARADFVTYSTVGIFDGGDAAGTNIYLDAANGIQINFNGIVTNTVNAAPSTTASFGAFDTIGTTAAAPVSVTSGFTLDIFQTAPTAGGPLSLVGALSGTLSFDGSQAHIKFNTPLSGSIGSMVYSITSADSGTPGQLNLVPPSTNSGISSLQGQIALKGVPAPSALFLAALGSPVLLARRRRQARAAS
jgi:hypothetical protein